MNIEICKNCPNFPEYYEFREKCKNELIFHGKRKLNTGYSDKFAREVSCVVIHKGIKLDGYMVIKYKPEKLLNRSKIVPTEGYCPYYVEHKLNEWNWKNEH